MCSRSRRAQVVLPMPAADRDVYPSRAADRGARAADRDDRAGPPRSLDAARGPRVASGPALASSKGASSTGSADRTTGTRGTRPRTAGTGEAGAAPRVVRPAELDARTSLVRHDHERRASHLRRAPARRLATYEPSPLRGPPDPYASAQPDRQKPTITPRVTRSRTRGSRRSLPHRTDGPRTQRRGGAPPAS